MSKNSEHSSTVNCLPSIDSNPIDAPSPDVLEEAMAAKARIRARIQEVADRIARPRRAEADTTASSDSDARDDTPSLSYSE